MPALRRILLALALLSTALPSAVHAWFVPNFRDWEGYLRAADVIFVASAIQPVVRQQVIVNGVIYPTVQVETVLRGDLRPGPVTILANYDQDKISRFLYLGLNRPDTINPNPYSYFICTYGVIPIADDFELASLAGKSPAEQLRLLMQHRLKILRAGHAVSSGDLSGVPVAAQIAHLETWLALPQFPSWPAALDDCDIALVGRPSPVPDPASDHEPAAECNLLVDAVLVGKAPGRMVRVAGLLHAQSGDEILVVGKLRQPARSGDPPLIELRGSMRVLPPYSSWLLQGKSARERLVQIRRGTGELRPHFTSPRSLERVPEKASVAQLWSWLERRLRR